jgi:hypothetical protein
MRIIALLLLISSVVIAEDFSLKNPGKGDMYTMKQDNDLITVRKSLPKIKDGMKISEVFAILGHPGIVYNNGFTYHDKQPDGSLLLGSKNGEVQFTRDGEVIKSHADIKNASGSVGAAR